VPQDFEVGGKRIWLRVSFTSFSATSPAKPWRHKTTLVKRRAHFSLNHANVSRRVALSHSSHAPRLMPKLASLYFGGLLETPVLCRYCGATR